MKVIESDKLRQRRDYTLTLERNVLGVPTFVLHAKSADKISVLEHSWVTNSGKMKFRFVRDPETPFPLVGHARFFDALVGIFSTRWNPQGDLWFSLSEITRFVDAKANSRGSRKAILEAILRYRRCSAEWENSWNGKTKSWNTHLIESTDIWDKGTGELKRNPRSSRKKEQLHRITFCKHIVESLKDTHTRVFLTDSLKQLKADSYAVYRYFHGFSDQSKVHRSVESLMSVFPWTGRKSRFRPWLEARLEECLEKGFIDSYEFKDCRVYVKCKSLREHQKAAAIIEIDSGRMAKKRPNTDKKKVAISSMTPQALLQEYFKRKQEKSISQEYMEIIDLVIAKKNVELTTSLLRSHLSLNK